MRTSINRSKSNEASSKQKAQVPEIQAKALYDGTYTIQRKSCACGGSCPNCKSDSDSIQTKLAISKPGDPYEQEADRVADQITGKNSGGEKTPVNKTVKVSTLQRQSTSNNKKNTIPSSVSKTLNHSGQSLNAGTRSRMEPHFGKDFSNVRVHTGAQAAESAKDVHAKAYTVGTDIVFNNNQYSPGTKEGDRLLAHELTHVVQQNGDLSRSILQRDGETSGDSEVPSATPEADTPQTEANNPTDEAVPAQTTAAPKCKVKSFTHTFGSWNISWPWPYVYKTTTIRLPVDFRVDLDPSCTKSDCLIGQRKMGRTQTKTTLDEFPTMVADGDIGHRYWWDGSNWYGGGPGSWDTFGTDGADFKDEPGFNKIDESEYPLYWGGVGRKGYFQFETFIADKATYADVSVIKWEMLIDYSTPKVGTHDKK